MLTGSRAVRISFISKISFSCKNKSCKNLFHGTGGRAEDGKNVKGGVVRVEYRGTSLIRNSPPVGTYSSICLGPYGGPGGRAFV